MRSCASGRPASTPSTTTSCTARPGSPAPCSGCGGRNTHGAASTWLASRKPARLSFEEAASIPVAAVTALQALRDRGRLAAGQTVLINGASGGVGTFAVQLAKAMGAEVTGVCSTRNVELVRSLGADHVVDYTAEDFTGSGRRYELVVNCAEGRSLRDLRQATAPEGRIVLVTGSLAQMAASLARRDVVAFIADVTRDDLLYVGELVEAGELRPVIERAYALEQAGDAIRHVATRHVRGKVVVTL
jgi:NADPH:quinone reductase-like Zn-dependent oxidoreductase